MHRKSKFVAAFLVGGSTLCPAIAKGGDDAGATVSAIVSPVGAGP
jgi:hypothetical protein